MLFDLTKAIITITFLQGRSTPYYGYSKSDWDALSEVDKTLIEKEYVFIKNTREGQKLKDMINARTQSIIHLGVNGGRNRKSITMTAIS